MKYQTDYLLMVVAITLLLAGCSQVDGTMSVILTEAATIPTVTESATPTHDAKASVSTRAAETKSAKQTNVALTPTVTPTVGVPLETILQDFPLDVGTKWVYRVTLKYDMGESTFTAYGDVTEPRWRTWTGFVTQSVTERTEQPQSVHPTFTILLQNYPYVTVNGIELDNHESKYVVKSNSIYQDDMRWIKLPLEVGAFWDPWDEYANPQEPGPEVWYVLDTESVETGIGTLDDCFFIQLAPIGDVMNYWICPGIGVARIYGWSSSGTLFEWVLESFSTPSE